MTNELTKITDDFGKTVYGKESWGEEYAITVNDDGSFQTSYMGEFISNHNSLCSAIEEIQNHEV